MPGKGDEAVTMEKIVGEVLQQAASQGASQSAKARPLGWTTWPLVLTEEVGNIARATLWRYEVKADAARAATVSLAAAAMRFVAWLDTERARATGPSVTTGTQDTTTAGVSSAHDR